MGDIIKDITELAERAGLNTVVGRDAVIEKMIDLAPKEGSLKLCSGFGVFPDGEECSGCKDCRR